MISWTRRAAKFWPSATRCSPRTRSPCWQEKGIQELDLLFIDGVNVSPCLRNTLVADKTATIKEAVLEIYRRLRPSNRPNDEVATSFFQNLFFNPEYYDLSPVGRLKLDLKLQARPRGPVALDPDHPGAGGHPPGGAGTHHPKRPGRTRGRHRPPG